MLLESEHENLKKLILEKCRNFDDGAVEFLNIPGLEELNLEQSNWSNVKVLFESDHEKLKKLNFEWCTEPFF